MSRGQTKKSQRRGVDASYLSSGETSTETYGCIEVFKGYRVGLSVAKDATLKGMRKAYRLYLPRILRQQKPSYRRTSSR
ncbi:hypothetical protein DPMN_074928 [Dreissena polymorpha]|uniref:Uncharacterized protein n=1 Tax=Dreissena polymorpha TaxID=45954 RepID=A0A9D3YH64_DREPO|nr:hypothetical protein DPMN_074924 [Dreissena polymorpha]KAH3699966.1 hypothetical protein DPMN_074928 [Dreissena polymorpha]